jgi:hypothetical protein
MDQVDLGNVSFGEGDRTYLIGRLKDRYSLDDASATLRVAAFERLLSSRSEQVFAVIPGRLESVLRNLLKSWIQLRWDEAWLCHGAAFAREKACSRAQPPRLECASPSRRHAFNLFLGGPRTSLRSSSHVSARPR